MAHPTWGVRSAFDGSWLALDPDGAWVVCPPTDRAVTAPVIAGRPGRVDLSQADGQDQPTHDYESESAETAQHGEERVTLWG